MTTSIFAVGSTWFWILTIAAIVLSFTVSQTKTSSKNPSNVGGMLVIGAYLLILDVTGSCKPLFYIRDHPILILSYIAIYLVVGLMWAMIKWVLYCYNNDEKKQNAFDSFKRENKLDTSLTVSCLDEKLLDKLDSYFCLNNLSRKPLIFKEHKAYYINWVLFWVYNILASLLTDFFYRVAEYLVKLVAGKMQAFSNSVNSKWVR